MYLSIATVADKLVAKMKNQIHDYIQEHKKELVDTLKELIKIPSVRGETKENAPFGEECARVLEFTKNLYEDNGFDTELDREGGYLLSYYGEGKRSLGIFAHADVVPVNDDDDVKNQILIVPNELVEVDKNKNVVLCGSMRFKDHIIKISERLKAFGFNPLLPEECIRGEKKEIASRAHFDRISNPDNGIVLIVNVTKNGIPNYIGPSTFAEIAMGFYYRKKVVLLNDIYHPYDDELLGWNVVTLKGQLEKLRELYMQ